MRTFSIGQALSSDFIHKRAAWGTDLQSRGHMKIGGREGHRSTGGRSHALEPRWGGAAPTPHGSWAAHTLISCFFRDLCGATVSQGCRTLSIGPSQASKGVLASCQTHPHQLPCPSTSSGQHFLPNTRLTEARLAIGQGPGPAPPAPLLSQP